PEIIDQIPESVARENMVIPIAENEGVLTVAMSKLDDWDTIQKLQFILNKDIQVVVAPIEQIIATIDRHYGQSEFELVIVDSAPAEFTDTAIDFTESESLFVTDFELPALCDDVGLEVGGAANVDTDLESSDFDLALSDEACDDDLREASASSV